MPHLLIDLTNGNGVQPGDSGAPPIKSGYAYERDLKRVVAHGSNSRTVYFFDTTTGTWSQKQFSGDTPDSAQANGTFGRWQYVPELRGCVLVNSTSSPVYFYRTA